MEMHHEKVQFKTDSHLNRMDSQSNKDDSLPISNTGMSREVESRPENMEAAEWNLAALRKEKLRDPGIEIVP
jgi:hypothetical protein